MKKLVSIIGLLSIIMISPGCGFEFNNTANRLISVLNQTTNDLNANASNFNSILEETINKIEDADIKAQLKDILQSTTVLAGQEIKCSTRFAVDYSIARIERIKASILKQPIPQQNPFICTTLPPDGLDMNVNPNQRNKILFNGFFFNDNFKDMNLKLVQTNNQHTDVTRFLSKSSDFSLIANLGSNGIRINSRSQKLILYWKQNPLTEVPIIQPVIEKCATRNRNLKNLPNLILIPKSVKYRNKQGDKEFKGHGPCTRGSIRLSLSNSNTELWAEGSVDMWECPDDLNKVQSDYTYGKDTKRIKLATASNGWYFKRIQIETRDRFQNIDRNHKIETIPGGGPVLEYAITGDLDGSDLGSSKVVVRFRSISVLEEERGNCLLN